MIDNYEVGQVLQGKVTGIQPYGAFVALDEDVQGLVHISEVTHGYVKDIHEYLTVGDEVTVKVLSIDAENNKISLSIRATEEAPKQTKKPKQQAASQDDSNAGFNTLKDKLQEWMDQSETFKK
ncbi:S1 domain-containing post-transcriptional regulator GSP13 [Virgibacillus sp. 179-BFC.A HS]|uniref:S1 domain-containing post-transcriptional regulator GSP13 n=1 Tax=Tigheibacillus jepli TaxID=3035914 RepID=A0ABU5CG11_9BACI|nr:S1 domain-containing post-transcriptional regulator GSP13 [Virgibacillus sp. 179-BFC.A HS]MDY0405258.1 S1 domain-containing post-transcriptional regulator GSP13 [Virgibacillus sp. 179-BFC.A HS]